MSLRSLEIAVVEAMVAIKRNFLMSLASIVTAGLTLGILGGFVLLALGLNHFMESQLTEFQASVWLGKGLSQQTVAKLQTSIKHLPHVTAVEVITSAAAWEKIKHDLGDQVDLTGVNRPDLLTDHFVLRLDDLHYMSSTAEAVRKMPGVGTVLEPQSAVKLLVGIGDIVKWVGGSTAILLLMISAFIISNTIRLTVYSRRREIKIMQLVGATNWFIRFPLLVEGTLLGTLGGGIACALVFSVSTYAAGWAANFVSLSPQLASQLASNVDPILLFGALVALGWAIGALGTLMSIQKFLKV